MSKELTLANSEKVTIVDDDVYEWASLIRWRLSTGSGYAVYKTTKDGKNVEISLARAIVGLKKGDKLTVDHVNRNRLDNRKENLRVCSHRENTWNRQNNRTNTSSSGIQGVHWWTQKGKWRVDLTICGKKKHVGVFDDIKKAEVAYLSARKKAFGEFHYG